MAELKVGIKAMEARFDALKAEVLATKYAPQVWEAPNLGVLTQTTATKYEVDAAIVAEVLGQKRFMEVAKVTKTDLEKAATSQELKTLNERKAIHTFVGAVSYSFKAAKPVKE